jgi:hypothetical protein
VAVEVPVAVASQRQTSVGRVAGGWISLSLTHSLTHSLSLSPSLTGDGEWEIEMGRTDCGWKERVCGSRLDPLVKAHTRTHARTHTHAHTRTRAHAHAHARARQHTHAPTHAHARAHALTRTRTHTPGAHDRRLPRRGPHRPGAGAPPATFFTY